MIKHELNEGFHWENRKGPFRLLSEEQVRQYDELGFVVLEDVFDADTISELIAELDPIERQMEDLLKDRFGGKMFIARADEITFTLHAVIRSPKANEFTRCAFFRDLTHDLLGDDVRLYWDQIVYKKPGTVDVFPWHQDNGYTYVEPQQYLTCWVALTDATPDNGCPWVLPGLHRLGTQRHKATDLGFVCVEEPETSPVAAPVRKGGIVVLSSLTPHCTGSNRTERVRKSYIVQFAPDGAVVYPRGADGEEELESEGVPADARDRQFPILARGVPVASAGPA